MTLPKSRREKAVTPFSLYDHEEAVIDRADVMLASLEDVADGVRGLAGAYRRFYLEQQRLVRLSDRMQLDLQKANQKLVDQARELRELNETLSNEIRHRARLEEELRRLAETDSLTGVLTRRRFIELGEREWRRQERVSAPICVLMLDLDWFKRLNDAHGHAAGDAALVAFAASCRTNIRALDLVGRLGGEEFAILLPDAGIAEGRDIAERVRLAVVRAPVGEDEGRIPVSVSIGVAEGKPGETLESAMSRADSALYLAKHAGRNCVRVAAADIQTLPDDAS